MRAKKGCEALNIVKGRLRKRENLNEYYKYLKYCHNINNAMYK